MADGNGQLTTDVIYEMVAEAGFEKYFHLGGFEATKELLELCQLDSSSYLLDVGCASGKTACYIASTYGCRVIGVDLLPGMVERASERARREGVADSVEFRVGDAQALPFEDDQFDVVMGEFITGLLDDKQGAVRGYVRVAKPGGTVALNEATWIQTPPPEELVERLEQVFGFRGELLEADAWQELLENAGLSQLIARTHKAESLSNRRADLADVLGRLPKVLYMLATNRTFRLFLKESASLPENMLDYFGYGLYVGKKLNSA